MVDPGSYTSIRALVWVLQHMARGDLEAVSTKALQTTLGHLLRMAEAISDELDDRQGL